MTIDQHALTAHPGARDAEDTPRRRTRQIRQFVVPILLITEIILFATLSDTFLTAGNLANVALNSVDLALIAAGLTFVIILGGIDVSTGPVLGVVAWVVGTLTLAGVPP